MTQYDQASSHAVRIIESLRSGVPTRLSTLEMPDLRPQLTKTIKEDLDSLVQGQVPQGRLVWGEYGQGKSHLLVTIAHLALEMGFAVSFVSLSREVSCHDLLYLYQRVAPVIRTPHSKVPGLRERLGKERRRSLEDTPIKMDAERYIHRRPAVTLELLLECGADSEESDNLYRELMGYQIPTDELRYIADRLRLGDLVRDLPRFRHDHAKAYFGLLADVVRWCGYKGWVILIDEVELIARLGKLGRLHAYRNLHWLLNWEDDMPYPIYLLGAAAKGLQTLWIGDADRRRRPDRETIPELAKGRLNGEASKQLSRFFEFALGDDHNLIIEPLARKDVFPLLKRLVELHGRAYAWNPPSDEWVLELISRLPDDTKLRTYIRYLIEALDQKLLTGKSTTPTVERLSEPSANEDKDFFRRPDEDS